MEYRKIIEFGKSSYIVSLPKKWISLNNLKKGDLLYLDESGDRIIISPKDKQDKREKKKIEIDVTNMDMDEIQIVLFSKYIQNYNEITFKDRNLKSKARQIRDMVHNLMALEVIEETGTKIVARDFLNMKEISPTTFIKKIDIITREMLADSRNMFEEDKHANIAERDGDVNRLTLLLIRSLKFLLENPSLIKQHKISFEDVIVMWDISDCIEKVADQAKRIAKLMPRMQLHKNEKKDFVKIYTRVIKFYCDAMDIYFKKDVNAAIKEVPKGKIHIKKCRDFYRANWEVEWVPIIIEEMKTIIAMTKSILIDICDIELGEKK
jgi:phosphate uptake regulator